MRLRDLASLRVALWATMLLAPGHTLIFGLLTPEPPLLELIARKSSGNPLFALDLLRWLRLQQLSLPSSHPIQLEYP